MPPHGTRGRYRLKCGCDKCRKWKSDDMAAYRERKRAAEAGESTSEGAPRARPTRATRPTRPRAEAGVADPERAVSVRRPGLDDPLAQMIDDALFDARGDSATAAIVAAERIREAGWVHRDEVEPLDLLEPSSAIERAAREALTDPKDGPTRFRHEVIFRGARSLDDPKNARYFASTVEAVRRVLADLIAGGGADDAAAIMDAIRGASGD